MKYTIDANADLLRARVWGRDSHEPPFQVCQAIFAEAQHRIALVHHTPGFYEANDMIEIVAGNRGLNVKNFRDIDAALAWLG